MAAVCFDSPVVPSRLSRGSCLSACAVVAFSAACSRTGIFGGEFSLLSFHSSLTVWSWCPGAELNRHCYQSGLHV